MQGRQAEGITEFYCPITLMRFENPVVAADGHTYEKAKIEEWLEKRDTSPLTGEILPHKNLVPNHTLKKAILQFDKYCEGMSKKIHDQTARLKKTQESLEHLGLLFNSIATRIALMEKSHQEEAKSKQANVNGPRFHFCG